MRKYFIVIFFFLILLLPMLLNLFDVNAFSETSENRKLQEKPKFVLESENQEISIREKVRASINEIFLFKAKFETYLNDNFIFKPHLFAVYRDLNQKLFNTNPLPQKNVNGRNDRMFLGDSFSDVIRESCGLKNLSDEDLLRIENNLIERKRWLNEQGIKYYVVVPPNKHTVYSEDLSIKTSDLRKTPLEQFSENIKKTDIDFIDLTSVLNQAKERGNLYHKTDSHWNNIGAFFAYQEIVKYISKDFPEITPVKFEDLEISDTIVYQQDLSKMLDMKVKETIPLWRVRAPKAFQKEPSLTDGLYTDLSVREYQNPEKELKILVFRDSFCSALVPFLSENFGELIFIWSFHLNKDIVLDLKPDIVLHEIVERELECF